MYLYVYGTLKKNRHNHKYLDGAEFIGNFITSKDFTLAVSELPFMIKRPSKSGVRGEVYKINSKLLKDIDMLEGHPLFYKREKITVYNEDTQETLKVYAYIHPDIFNQDFWLGYEIKNEF